MVAMGLEHMLLKIMLWCPDFDNKYLVIEWQLLSDITLFMILFF